MEKIIKLISSEKKTAEKVLNKNSAYAAGYIDGLRMVLNIIRDCSEEDIKEMAKYYGEA